MDAIAAGDRANLRDLEPGGLLGRAVRRLESKAVANEDRVADVDGFVSTHDVRFAQHADRTVHVFDATGNPAQNIAVKAGSHTLFSWR